jgi:hypothetical protein
MLSLSCMDGGEVGDSFRGKVTQAFNPSTQEVETAGSQAWSQPGLQSKTLSQNSQPTHQTKTKIKTNIKEQEIASSQGLTLVILASWEAEIRRITHSSRSAWANSSQDPVSKITRKKMDWRHDSSSRESTLQTWSPEFKPQSRQNKTKKQEINIQRLANHQQYHIHFLPPKG